VKVDDDPDEAKLIETLRQQLEKKKLWQMA